MGKVYKNMMEQIPMRTDKILHEVEMAGETVKTENKGRTNRFKFVMAVSVLMIVVLLSVSVLPGTNQVTFVVYASERNQIELGSDAVKLRKQIDFESAGVSIYGDKQKAELVYRFDIKCEGENLKRITYAIEGEKTAANIHELGNHTVWFAEVVDISYDSSRNRNYPFTYRSYENGGKRETYVYLGSQYTVDANHQNDKYYCIEYRMEKDSKSKYHTQPFDICVSIEKTDGSMMKKVLHLIPEFDVMNGEGGTVANGENAEFYYELWVSEK